ncbi:MAG: UDP-N-acetyl-D-mannosaminuronic acid dehydrogenase [Chloroflexota bacterium]|jgi:UDP-N-acetyl-D-mannosaminuronic acid dehydrogenase|nr:UDP-N-acetyl-D-mannosaminuronic acid dehydrogenase [Chloroflexota bacterium]
MTSVGVIGTGRVGLPLALILADKGLDVVGLDVNADYVRRLKNGEMPFWEEGAGELLERHIDKGFHPTDDPAALTVCDYLVLTLGTPVDSNMDPDLSQIDAALDQLGPHLKKGQTLVLRSTVSPGTTRWVRAKLEDELGFKVGTDLFLAFCPERIAEGRALKELTTVPQIVGGIDAESSRRAAALFKPLGVEILETDDISAELAKLFTNMYRYINFSISNEFMIIAGRWQRDINHIVKLVNHGYARGGLALPGFTAGPCLFKDGFFLVNEIPFTDLITTAWKINESVPLFLVTSLKAHGELRNKKAVIMGAAFKADSDDPRQSLSFKVQKALERERANVVMHDPHVPGLDSDLATTLRGAEVVFVATNHTAYRHLTPATLRGMVGANCLVCDIWNIFDTDQVIFELDSAVNQGPGARSQAVSPG